MSIATQLANLPVEEFATMSDEHALALLYDWDVWARDKQQEPPGDWTIWLILAGRGFGKTRTGAEWVRAQVESGRCGRIALVGRTAADVRDVMVEGESGILAISPPWNKPRYEPSKRRVTWSNGAIATTYSADEPDLLRGPQHDGAWADERAAWAYDDTWDQLMFGLRLGKKPRCVVTTTPRPTKAIKQLVKAKTTYVTRGTTYENKANLAPTFLEQVVARYQSTRLGRQELEGMIIEDLEGALWRRQSMIEDLRVPSHPDLLRVVVAIDPAVTANEDSDETGMVVAGIGIDGHGYVLADKSMKASPNEWAQTAVSAYQVFQADRIIGESNNGGDMIEAIIRGVRKHDGAHVSYRAVHATRGKQLRAEPVAALYERGLVHHVGTFPDLEDQMCNWEPGQPSPDRLDALVWAFTELMVNATSAGGVLMTNKSDEDDDKEEENASYVEEEQFAWP